MWLRRPAPAMPRWIGVDGAGSCTIFSHRLQLFFSLAICSTLSPAQRPVRGDIIQELVDVLAEQAKLTAAIRTGVTRIENTAFSRQMSRQLLTTAFLLVFLVPVLGLIIGVTALVNLLGGAIGLKILERQFQLIDLTLQLLR